MTMKERICSPLPLGEGRGVRVSFQSPGTPPPTPLPRGEGRSTRADMLAELVSSSSWAWAYAPQFYEPEYHADGTIAAINRTRADVPREIRACTIEQDFDAIPLPTKPVVPFVETPHDRIALEIMRGCPWQCRFCQSTVIKIGRAHV